MSDDESVASINENEWKLINRPPAPEVVLGRVLVQIERKTRKDTIFYGPYLPVAFNPNDLPYGLEPDSLEVQLLACFYATPTYCQHANCRHVLNNFTERVLHHVYKHLTIPLYVCVADGCLHIFDNLRRARIHYNVFHRESSRNVNE